MENVTSHPDSCQDGFSSEPLMSSAVERNVRLQNVSYQYGSFPEVSVSSEANRNVSVQLMLPPYAYRHRGGMKRRKPA
jgi:hypothetical protein